MFPHLTLNVNSVCFLPHLRLQRLSWIHGLYETHLSFTVVFTGWILSVQAFKWYKMILLTLNRLKSRCCFTLMDLNLETSFPAYCLRTWRAAKPNEHRPWRMGDLNPAGQQSENRTASVIGRSNRWPRPKLTPLDDSDINLEYFNIHKERVVPPIAAKLGSMCSGFQSPLNRYRAAWTEPANSPS